MNGPFAELSSLATALDDLNQRLSGVTAKLNGPQRDETAAQLLEVERLLDMAERRLDKVIRRERR